MGGVGDDAERTTAGLLTFLIFRSAGLEGSSSEISSTKSQLDVKSSWKLNSPCNGGISEKAPLLACVLELLLADVGAFATELEEEVGFDCEAEAFGAGLLSTCAFGRGPSFEISVKEHCQLEDQKAVCKWY